MLFICVVKCAEVVCTVHSSVNVGGLLGGMSSVLDVGNLRMREGKLRYEPRTRFLELMTCSKIFQFSP